MGLTFDNLDQDAGLKKLNGFLTNRSYIEGFQFSSADAALFQQFSSVPDPAKYANVYRWYVHTAAKLGLRSILKTAQSGPSAGAAKAVKKADKEKAEEEDGDDDDLFGDDDEEDDEATKALAAKRAEAASSSR